MITVEQIRAQLESYISKKMYREAYNLGVRSIDMGTCLNNSFDGYPFWQTGHALDALAGERSRVEYYYMEAIKRDPFNPMYHASLVCFYVDKKLWNFAKEAWLRAVDLTKEPDAVTSSKVYESLYGPVMLHSLHQTKTDFVREILYMIPSEEISSSKYLKRIFSAYRVINMNEELLCLTGEYSMEPSNALNNLPKTMLHPTRY